MGNSWFTWSTSPPVGLNGNGHDRKHQWNDVVNIGDVNGTCELTDICLRNDTEYGDAFVRNSKASFRTYDTCGRNDSAVCGLHDKFMCNNVSLLNQSDERTLDNACDEAYTPPDISECYVSSMEPCGLSSFINDSDRVTQEGSINAIVMVSLILLVCCLVCRMFLLKFQYTRSKYNKLRFRTAVNLIQVHVYRGDILAQKVDAIVCSTDTKLGHTSGLAKVVADRAGPALLKACRKIGYLRVGEAISVTSGNLHPDINHVILVAGPAAISSHQDSNRLQSAVSEMFFNCLCCANDKLNVKTVALPALCTGFYGVSRRVSAEAAYDALLKFDTYVAQNTKYVDEIRFINVDEDTNKTFVTTFSVARQQHLRSVTAVNVVPRDSRWSPRSPDAEGPDVHVPRVSVRRERRLKTASEVVSIEQSLTSLQHYTSQYTDVRDRVANGRHVDEIDERLMVDRDFGKTTSPQNTKQPLNKPSMSVRSQGAPLSAKDTDDADEDCVICMCPMTSPHRLPCGHSFCQDCIRQSFDKCGEKCPSCGRLFGVQRGNQPPGTMTDYIDARMQLAGYRGYDTIVVTYDIPDGIQSDDHPNPGQQYKGTHRTAYLPNNAEGREVLELLKRAFDARLIFTIGRSVTTGADNVVVWNDIHHKTNHNGPYGYPDGTYLTRIKAELAAKGIVPRS